MQGIAADAQTAGLDLSFEFEERVLNMLVTYILLFYGQGGSARRIAGYFQSDLTRDAFPTSRVKSRPLMAKTLF
ncbi:hypothetical protein ACIP01_23900 [Pseudomonas monteilii]|uniref:hypothetical protein n=1 Tax=Pseudomonas monteilii TaxID=76759 RepID=UPI003821EC72